MTRCNVAPSLNQVATLHVLIIDDDREFTSSLARYFHRHQIHLDTAIDVRTGRNMLRDGAYDALLLDVMLPGQSGFDFLPALRSATNIPVLMLTALGEEDHRVTGLNLGADDYITKPFSAKELVARLRSIKRRLEYEQTPAELKLDDMHLFPGRLLVAVGREEVPLTGVECGILQELMQAQDRTLTRDVLYRRVLGRDSTPMDRSLDVHISNLRRKLGAHPQKGQRIRALRGVGYVLTA